MSFIVKLIPFSRYKIVGHSMEPTVKDGQVVWVNRWAYLLSQPQVKDIVLFKLGDKFFVKRIIQVKKAEYLLSGDNRQDSLDSRQFGFVQQKDIVGKVRI